MLSQGTSISGTELEEEEWKGQKGEIGGGWAGGGEKVGSDWQETMNDMTGPNVWVFSS